MSPTRHLCIAKDLSAVKRPLIGRGSEGNDISSRNLAPFLGCAQKAEFCNADETETRAASREQRLPSGERASERGHRGGRRRRGKNGESETREWCPVATKGDFVRSYRVSRLSSI